jgi:hypothetical protein
LDPINYRIPSAVAAAARSEDDFIPHVADRDGWRRQQPDPQQWVWTDDYSNIIGAMWRRLK